MKRNGGFVNSFTERKKPIQKGHILYHSKYVAKAQLETLKRLLVNSGWEMEKDDWVGHR